MKLFKRILRFFRFRKNYRQWRKYHMLGLITIVELDTNRTLRRNIEKNHPKYANRIVNILNRFK
jgi:hypothetical protein